MLYQRLVSSLTPVLAAALLALPAAAQAPITPLNNLIANNASVSAAGVTFSNFQKPKNLLPTVVAVPANLYVDFNDIGVSANANADGTVSLVFSGIDAATGLPRPLNAEFLRPISYTVTMQNPGMRLHSVDQAFGAGTFTTGNMYIFNELFAAELVPNTDELMLYDQFARGFPAPFRTANRPSANGVFDHLGTGGILFPGGNLPTFTMVTQLVAVNGRFGLPADGAIDSVSLNFSLVPTGTPVPPEVVNLAQIGDTSPFGNPFFIDGLFINNGIGLISLTNFAQDQGAAVSLTSSNPAALPLPAFVTVPQGYWMSAFFPIGPGNVDVPTPVTITASYNGRIQSQPFTVIPTTPLTLSSLSVFQMQGAVPPNTYRIALGLSRNNVSPATIQLTSSNPAVAPVPATFTIAALGATDPLAYSFTSSFKLVPVDTPVTFTATFNGVTQTATITIPKTMDFVQITKAELSVKNGQLKVEASDNVHGATLTLYNNATGQLIGTMTDNGPSGAGEKYSFQGTASPVTTLLLKSSLNGTATFAVAQK